ncbi:MAG: hypothetical protein WBW33_37515, partial [Bryobacteraceae bacterium]
PSFGDDDMNAITRRLNRIEHQLNPTPPKPRTWFRVVIRREDPDAPVTRSLGREPSFEEATCTRSLYPDGTLWEVVRLDKISEDGEQPTDAELNTWIAGFPIEPLRPWQGFTQ